MASLEKQLDYEQVVSVSNTLKKDVNFIRLVLEKVNSTKTVVESNWLGMSQSAYLDNFYQTAKQFEPFCEYVESYADDLYSSAVAFKQHDEELSRLQGK